MVIIKSTIENVEEGFFRLKKQACKYSKKTDNFFLFELLKNRKQMEKWVRGENILSEKEIEDTSKIKIIKSKERKVSRIESNRGYCHNITTNCFSLPRE